MEHNGAQIKIRNVALYRLGGAQDDFACLLSTFFYGLQCSVVSLGFQSSTSYWSLSQLKRRDPHVKGYSKFKTEMICVWECSNMLKLHLAHNR